MTITKSFAAHAPTAATSRQSPSPQLSEVSRAFAESARKLGLEEPSGGFVADGTLRRCDVIVGGIRKKNAGAYQLFPGDVPAGWAQNWTNGEGAQLWCFFRHLTDDQQDHLRQHARASRQAFAAEEAQRHNEAADRAVAIWNEATDAPSSHPYLLRKGVQPHGIALHSDGRLLVPLTDVEGNWSSLQFIAHDGSKRFLTGGRKRGLFYAIGDIDPNEEIFICEGFATTATVREAAKKAAIVAFDCGNLLPVAKELRAKYPRAKLIFCADDDAWTDGNPGRTKAEEAAAAVGGGVVVPVFAGPRAHDETDFNDLAAAEGLKAVRRCLAEAGPRNDGDASNSGAEGAGAEASAAERSAACQWPEPLPLTNDEANDLYPLDALPDSIHDAVKEVHDYAQTPLAMVAMSALAALSAAAQGLVDVRRDAMLCGPVSLYELLIGESGERKTTGDKFFTKPLQDFERRKAEEMGPEIKAARARHAAWEAKKRGKEEKIKNDTKLGRDTTALENDLEVIVKGEPSVPRLPVLIRQDDTVEELAFSLAKGWPSSAIISSEAGLVFGSNAMGKENVLRGLSQKNIFWEGGAFRIGRRTSESFVVRGARLTIHLQAQEAAVRSFTKQSGDLARGIGFWARCLLAWPKSTQGNRPYKEPLAQMPDLDKFSRRIGALLEEPLPMDEDGTLTPAVLDFSADGKRLWVELYNAIEAELLPGGDCETIKDVASKAAENIARLAALFHVYEHGRQGEISADTVRRAGEIILWHLVEARRFFDCMAMPQERLDAIALDEWLRSKGGASSRDITHFGPNALRDGRWEKALELLDATGRARRIATGARGFKVEVNPALMGGCRVS